MSDDACCGGSEPLDAGEQRAAVRERYAGEATDAGGCCGGDPDEAARERGYSQEEVDAVAAGANLGLSCGNPTVIAGLGEGETVLDLGSGGGFDCFLAGREVGPEGRVVGVDMTPEMVERARENAAENDAANVEFRLGEIEHLPVADAAADVIISNCVVNLSPDKPQVFREAYRALRPGGRLAISDTVLTADLPEEFRGDPEAVAACVAGASTVDALGAMLADAGFEAVEIEPKEDSESFVREFDDERDPSEFVLAATIEAEKPTA